MDFKLGNEYEVLNGWKWWSDSSDAQHNEGGVGRPFSLLVECPQAICQISEAAASALFCTSVLLLATTLAY